MGGPGGAGRRNRSGLTGMMSLTRWQQGFSRSIFAAVLVVGAVALAGCSAGTMIADHLPTAAGGLPEGAPERPTKPSAFPAVHDLPPPRGSTVLTDAEQKKLEDDLIAARTRTGEAAKPGGRPD
jgi:hypothetical protein